MRFVKIGAIIVFGLALLLGVVSQLFKVQIGEMLFDRAVDNLIGGNVDTERPDGLHVVLVGSGSPLGDPTRLGPSTAIIAGERIFVIDVGSGSPRNLARFGVQPGAIEAVFITHFHSDHIDSLGELMLQRWAGGANTSPLPVHGPSGIERVVNGFNEAYAQDKVYRVAHHGVETTPPSGAGGVAVPFRTAGLVPSGQITLIDEGGLKVSAFSVVHSPVEPAVGYRFEYKGRSVTLTGDTAYSENLVANAKGTDLLIAEALNAEMVGKIGKAVGDSGANNLAKIMGDIPDYHITPVEGAEMAEKAGAKMLVFNHIVPALPLKYLEAYYAKGTRKAFSGPVIVGRDGMTFSLLPGEDKIRRK